MKWDILMLFLFGHALHFNNVVRLANPSHTALQDQENSVQIGK